MERHPSPLTFRRTAGHSEEQDALRPRLMHETVCRQRKERQ